MEFCIPYCIPQNYILTYDVMCEAIDIVEDQHFYDSDVRYHTSSRAHHIQSGSHSQKFEFVLYLIFGSFLL